jgi:small subunit ribosomal protein S16
VAVIIRLKRMGKENTAFYRIVVSDERKSAKSGPYIEELGFYNPVKNPPVIKLNGERALYWISKGAKTSPTIASIMKSQGVKVPAKAPKAKKPKVKKEKKAAK